MACEHPVVHRRARAASHKFVSRFSASVSAGLAVSYYTVLNVDRNASLAEIRKAYLGLARQYHPDLNRESVAASLQFKKVLRAYEVLSNPHQRRQYDQDPLQFERRLNRRAGGQSVGGGGYSVWITPDEGSDGGDSSSAGWSSHPGRTGLTTGIFRPRATSSPCRRVFRTVLGLALPLGLAAVATCMAMLGRSARLSSGASQGRLSQTPGGPAVVADLAGPAILAPTTKPRIEPPEAARLSTPRVPDALTMPGGSHSPLGEVVVEETDGGARLVPAAPVTAALSALPALETVIVPMQGTRRIQSANGAEPTAETAGMPWERQGDPQWWPDGSGSISAFDSARTVSVDELVFDGSSAVTPLPAEPAARLWVPPSSGGPEPPGSIGQRMPTPSESFGRWRGATNADPAVAHAVRSAKWRQTLADAWDAAPAIPGYRLRAHGLRPQGLAPRMTETGFTPPATRSSLPPRPPLATAVAPAAVEAGGWPNPVGLPAAIGYGRQSSVQAAAWLQPGARTSPSWENGSGGNTGASSGWASTGRRGGFATGQPVPSSQGPAVAYPAAISAGLIDSAPAMLARPAAAINQGVVPSAWTWGVGSP